jgi:pimeloyl-ACP methyl ester carboxylesterase
MTRNILLLPGFGCDGDSMRELHEALEASGHTVVVIDFTGDSSLEAMAETVLHELIKTPSSIVGFSMGGWVAQALAARAGNHVQRLVLISSWTRAPASYLEIVEALHRRIEDGESFASLRNDVADGITDRSRAGELADRWVAMAERVGVEAFLSETAAILAHPDIDAEAREIEIPTLVLAGSNDTLIPSSAQEADARLVDGSRFLSIEHSGHNLVWEQPQATNEAILAWLEEPEE